MSWAAIVVGAGTLIYGAVKSGQANKKLKQAIKDRKPYKTPDEVFKILNATENKSQGDTATRDFQTNQLDRAFSNQLGVDLRLGADPNDTAALFDRKMQGILQIGEQFHASNMEAFGKYLGALDMVVQNKAAEQGSADNMQKDLIQSLAQQKADYNKTINSGLNTSLAGLSSMSSNDLYTQKDKAGADGTAGA